MLHVSPTTPFKLIESYVGAKICTVVFHLKFCSRLFEECDEHQDCFPAECRKRRNSRSFEVTCAHNAHSSSGRLIGSYRYPVDLQCHCHWPWVNLKDHFSYETSLQGQSISWKIQYTVQKHTVPAKLIKWLLSILRSFKFMQAVTSQTSGYILETIQYRRHITMVAGRNFMWSVEKHIL